MKGTLIGLLIAIGALLPLIHCGVHQEENTPYFKKILGLTKYMLEGDYENVYNTISTANKLMKNGKIEVRPWNNKEYIKKLFSEFKYNKIDLKASGKSNRNSLSFWVYFEMEDLVNKIKFQGHEIMKIEFQGASDEILSIDRIFNNDDKRRELFPEIDFHWDVQVEWVAETHTGKQHQPIY